MSAEPPKLRIDQLPELQNPSAGSRMYMEQGGILSQIAVSNLWFPRVFFQGSAPTGVRTARDYWIDTANGNDLKRWNGSVWARVPYAYSNLSGRPALGTASAQNVEAFATSAQGALADTALQPGDMPDMPNNLVVVNSVDDLPSPSGGLYNLLANTTYLICGAISTGSNSIKLGDNTVVRGINPWISQINYGDSSGNIFQGSDVNALIKDLTVTASNSAVDFLQYENIPKNKSLLIDGVFVIGAGLGVIIEAAKALSIKNCVFDLDNSSAAVVDFIEGVDDFCFDGNIVNGHKIIASNSVTLDCFRISNNKELVYDHDDVTVGEFGLFSTNNGLTVLNCDAGTPRLQFSANGGVQDTLYTAKYGFTDNATATDITTQNVWVKIEIATAAADLNRFAHESPNELEYLGITPRSVRVISNIRLESPNNSVSFQVGLFKNDELVASSTDTVECRTQNVLEAGIINTYVLLENGDKIDVRIRNLTGVQNPTIQSMNVTVGE